MRRPLANSYWVLPGTLLAGEYPSGDQPAETQKRLRRLLEAGIDTFIDLTQAGERPEYQTLLPPHVRYLRSGITDTRVPAELRQMRAIQTHLQAALAEGRRVYVHCRAGIGRTGLVVGCFLAEEQGDGKAAIKHLNRLWRQSARAETWRKVPQTPEQADYIRHWPRLAKGDSAA